MSGRPQRQVPKQDYLLLHTECQSRSSSDSEVEALMEHEGRNDGFHPIPNPEFVVQETPLVTPAEPVEGSDGLIVPKTQSPQNRSPHNKEVSDNTLQMADENTKNLEEELDKAKMEERKKQLEEEQREMEKTAKMLTEQIALEAKERQLAAMRRQIQDLQEARKRAHAGDPVIVEEVLNTDETAKQMHEALTMLQKKRRSDKN